jgi:ribosomal protein L3
MVVLYDARPIRFGLVGSGDIIGVSRGRGFAIETKKLTGKQAEQQAKFGAAFERAGGIYGLAFTPDQAVRLLGGDA